MTLFVAEVLYTKAWLQCSLNNSFGPEMRGITGGYLLAILAIFVLSFSMNADVFLIISHMDGSNLYGVDHAFTRFLSPPQKACLL